MSVRARSGDRAFHALQPFEELRYRPPALPPAPCSPPLTIQAELSSQIHRAHATASERRLNLDVPSTAIALPAALNPCAI